MKGLKQFIKSAFALPVAAVLALSVGLASGLSGHAGAQQMVRDHSSNSIVKGGTVSAQEFVDKARANNPNDLQAIYEAYGLKPAHYDSFRQHAVMGTAHKNGNITYKGKVVARDAYSLGREKKAESTVRTINGKAYYETRSQDVFNSDTIPALIVFDKQGNYAFGVLTACGNPLRAKPVIQVKPAEPTARCESLQAAPVSGEQNTYSFTTRTAVTENAKISRVVYDFGDGSATVSRTNPAEAVRHTYANPGNYTAKVTVYIQQASGGETTSTGATCTAPITVQAAPVAPVSTPPAAPAPAPAAPVAAPAVLPATGVGEFIALFTAVSVLGSAGYYVYAKRRLLQSS